MISGKTTRPRDFPMEIYFVINLLAHKMATDFQDMQERAPEKGHRGTRGSNVSRFTLRTHQMLHILYINKPVWDENKTLPVSIWGSYFGTWCPGVCHICSCVGHIHLSAVQRILGRGVQSLRLVSLLTSPG